MVRLAGWKHIPGSKDRLIYLCPRRYKGDPITLKDGTVIQKNDLVAEIHLDNTNILNIEASYISMAKALQKEMGALKEAMKQSPMDQLKGVYGITVIYPIAERIGFTSIRIRNPFKRFFGSLWENILRLVLKKAHRGRKKGFIEARECWLSRNQIDNMGAEMS